MEHLNINCKQINPTEEIDKEKCLNQIIDLMAFFSSKPPSYWNRNPEDFYCFYHDLSVIEDCLSQDV
jgi:hypothetical protein